MCGVCYHPSVVVWSCLYWCRVFSGVDCIVVESVSVAWEGCLMGKLIAHLAFPAPLDECLA